MEEERQREEKGQQWKRVKEEANRANKQDFCMQKTPSVCSEHAAEARREACSCGGELSGKRK